MFPKKISVIHLKKDILKVAVVSLGKTPRILKTDESGWNQESLIQTLSQIKPQLPSPAIRLLLDQDFVHILNLKIPLATDPQKQPLVVTEAVKSLMPEILENDHWDYEETGKKDQTNKELLAFAPVKEKLTFINQALAEAKLLVEAIEPETVSVIRHEDPIIGIALKKDLKAKDKKPPSLSPQPDTQSTPSKAPSAPKINKNSLIIFFTVTIISALIAGGILVSRNALNSISQPSPSPVFTPPANQLPSPIATASASPEPEIVLSDYKLLVLNGTGGKGVAAAVKDILETEGFANIKADNADKLDFIQTEVQLKKTTPQKIFETIDKALSSDYEVTQSAKLLTDDFGYDVVITVGELKK